MLDLKKLEKVKHRPGSKITAQCPACHESGADRAGEHLVYWMDTERFACSANEGDGLHRKRIWALAGLPEDRPPLTDAEKARWRAKRNEKQNQERQQRAVDAAARNQRNRIFNADWDPADIWEASPVRLDGGTPDWRLMLGALYQPEDVIWTGDRYHSGPGYEKHFRPVREWLSLDASAPPFPHTCPDIFSAGVCSRAAASVTASPFIVVEADEAIGRKPATAEERAENIRRNLAVLRWLKEDLHWTLRAVVHTGGKSCHGWFNRPSEKHVAQLKAAAPELGIDASVFSPAHPVRLPGVKHEKTGELSRMLYLAL